MIKKKLFYYLINNKMNDVKAIDIKPKSFVKKGTFTSLHNDIKVYNIHIIDSNKIDKHPHRYHLIYNSNNRYYLESPSTIYGYDKIESLYKIGLTRQLVQADLDEYLNNK